MLTLKEIQEIGIEITTEQQKDTFCTCVADRVEYEGCSTVITVAYNNQRRSFKMPCDGYIAFNMDHTVKYMDEYSLSEFKRIIDNWMPFISESLEHKNRLAKKYNGVIENDCGCVHANK